MEKCSNTDAGTRPVVNVNRREDQMGPHKTTSCTNMVTVLRTAAVVVQVRLLCT